MIWRLTYYTVMACWLLFITYALIDHYPVLIDNPVSNNPIITAGAVGCLFLLIRSKPWRES